MIPLPSKWIPWALAFACAACFAVALLWPHPTPDVTPLIVAHQTTTERIAVKDSVQSRVKVAHASSGIQLKRLAPLRSRVALTSDGIVVDGSDSLSGLGVGVVAKVIAAQDTVIDRLKAESAVKDTAIVAGDSALAASQRETRIAVSMLPSKWSRVRTAVQWVAVGVLAGLATHAVLAR